MKRFRFFFHLVTFLVTALVFNGFALAQDSLAFRCEVDPQLISENVPIQNVTPTLF
jgi:hypothetical protein